MIFRFYASENYCQYRVTLFELSVIPVGCTHSPLAILDPTLPMKMSPALSAGPAFDALNHAIESSIANIANEFTVSWALGSFRLIFKHLPDAYDSDPHAREQMHYTATMAGIGINNSSAGLAHGMDQLGLFFSVSHGVICPVLLSITLAFTLEASVGQFAEMGRVLSLSGQREKELVNSFLHEL